jgi:thioesterase domain-containing protein
VEADLVIGRCDIQFIKPVGQDFLACCSWPEEQDVQAFFARLSERGRASLVLEPELRIDGEVAARLRAKYAALMRD